MTEQARSEPWATTMVTAEASEAAGEAVLNFAVEAAEDERRRAGGLGTDVERGDVVIIVVPRGEGLRVREGLDIQLFPQMPQNWPRPRSGPVVGP